MSLPAHLRDTPEFAAALERVRAAARAQHEKNRKAAAKRGRLSFPELPYECSWAFEEEFRRTFNSR